MQGLYGSHHTARRKSRMQQKNNPAKGEELNAFTNKADDTSQTEGTLNQPTQRFPGGDGRPAREQRQQADAAGKDAADRDDRGNR